MASKTANPGGGASTRRLLGFICIVSGLVCGYFMDVPGMINNYPEPSSTGFIEWKGGKVRILERFHWIEFLDTVFRNVTVGFAPSAFGYDDVSRWMMCPFMLDMGVWYMIWLLESSREGNKGTTAGFPALWATIAQIAGGGVFIPIYYGVFLIFTTPIAQQTAAKRKINLKDACIYLPLLFVFHYGPVAAMLYHPTLEGRHYWSWFWQLYSVRMTIAYYAITFLIAYLPLSTTGSGTLFSYRTTIVLMFTPLIAISAALWIYTILSCPYPLSQVFWPQALVVDTWLGRLRRILQFDFLFLNGTGLLWAFGLLRDAGMQGVGGTMKFALVAGIATLFLGPAAALGTLWVWRELLVDAGEGEKIGPDTKGKEG